MTGFSAPPHIKLACKLAQRLEEDVVDRAMIFMPPRHSKTTLFSDLFPSWILGRHPTSKLMSVAHTERFAKKLGGKVRGRTRQPEWPFAGVHLAQDTQAKEAFATPQGGEYNGFGMFGGNQHGNPAEWLFMDDIIKGRKIAMSPHMREEAWETYRTDLLSRLEGRAKQLIVFTRWHMDDPAGRILPEGFDGRTGWYRDRETGEKWFVLSLAAVAEHDDDPLGRSIGDWLWPEKFGEAKLGGMRKRGGWVWSSLYQQRPSPEDGLMFTPDHIQRYSPGRLDHARLRIYITSDYAVTSEAGASNPDYTVHMVWGVDEDHNIYLLDMWRGRTTSDVWIREWIRLCKKWKPLRSVEEAGQIMSGVGPFIKMMMRKEKVFVSRVQLTSSTSKEQRAQGLLGMAEMGKMFLPHRTEIRKTFLAHLDAFEQELMQFPTAPHDDTVDAATLFGRYLDKIIEGEPAAPPKSPHGETLNDLFSRHENQQD
jgi:predicted phage terminase large subunit-like protein